MEKKRRKHPRLKQYDYSLPGYYYVTIRNVMDAPVLSHIRNAQEPWVQLTRAGMIVQQQLMDLENRYRNVRVDKYVIMPNHIHMIICLTEPQDPEVTLPRLTDIVCAFKSITTRMLNIQEQTPGKKAVPDILLRVSSAYGASIPGLLVVY